MGAPMLRICLLGEFDLRCDGAPLPPLESARAESLLTYLLLHREAPQHRQHLAFLLWPDSAESQARTNLRHVLHTLRHALPDADQFLAVTPRTLQWRADASCWLDVAVFEAALARAEQATGDACLSALQEAVEVYRGDLLEGCYDEWLLGERERLRQGYLEALDRVITLLEARNQHRQAILYAERLLRHDPLHEATYQRLMHLHEARGDRARALRVYHVCAATLARELGIEPSVATRAAYDALVPPAREPAGVASRSGGPSGPPFVGRLAERARLRSLWQATEASGPQFVLVTGEPGIGKTRLVEEFQAWCAQRGATTAAARSYPAEGALPYAPLVAWLRAEPLMGRRARLDRVRLTELARLLPELLTEIPDLAPPDPLPVSDQRQRLFDAAARAILVTGGRLLLIADDLHWWDRESLQFLHYLLRVEPAAHLLVAATARPEEIDPRHPLNDLRAGLLARGCLTEIELGRLARDESALIAERVTGQPFTEPAADQFYRATEGNPLFVIEALRAGWTSRQAGQGWTSPKVRAVIEARLEQLSEPARDLVGIAATIGRAFTTDVLASSSDADEQALVRGLDELWRRRIVREQGADAYDFSHDKIREVAYLALSPARRRLHHRRVAQALEHRHASDLGPVSGQIAGHYECAGVADRAVIWYERAVVAAQQVHANHEAIRLLGRALDLLRTLPMSPTRDARELAILTAFPGPIAAAEGFASHRLIDVQRRASELARSLGVQLAPPLLRSLALASLCDDDFAAAREIGVQLQARGECDADDVLLVEADYVLGIAAFWSGELHSARRHFEAAVARYRPEQRRVHLHWYGQDTKVICLSRLANTLWFLGHAQAATRARDTARALAEEIGHPYSQTAALMFAAVLALDMRDPDYLREHVAALRAMRLVDEARQIQISSEALSGYIDIRDGHTEVGIARIQRVLDEALRTQHAPGARAFMMRLLLEACATAGDAWAGLAAADQALALGGARLWEAEVLRLRAEFRAVLGASPADVALEFDRAIHVAHHQGAKMLELRAAVSRLHHQRRHGAHRELAEAHDALAGLVEALPEARDSHDLREARELLAQQ